MRPVVLARLVAVAALAVVLLSGLVGRSGTTERVAVTAAPSMLVQVSH